ncbi:dihydroneopterin aldolase [Natronospira proteinivora]|uniref:7,8-dihydroneopterin aldolase n=1 Tax=Natronospira proteinivora TaxID=1807133 RepID=A0ABT1GAX0_9GAMM|nr:dihydroneopterin aldolase [Natronospira proteinivora]MCP1728464.1 dihydroneopterin aldolase [Natronospira proteinivora]
MDTVYIRGLKARTVVGIFEWERRLPQDVILDIEMSADVRTAAASDAIADALNYKEVCKAVKAHVEASEYQLVETLAESITRLIVLEFDVPRVSLVLNKKGALTDAADVGIRIERGREDYADVSQAEAS